jgi:hypothetical protein
MSRAHPMEVATGLRAWENAVITAFTFISRDENSNFRWRVEGM